jgi:hypothetical protein
MHLIRSTTNKKLVLKLNQFIPLPLSVIVVDVPPRTGRLDASDAQGLLTDQHAQQLWHHWPPVVGAEQAAGQLPTTRTGSRHGRELCAAKHADLVEPVAEHQPADEQLVAE